MSKIYAYPLQILGIFSHIISGQKIKWVTKHSKIEHFPHSQKRFSHFSYSRHILHNFVRPNWKETNEVNNIFNYTTIEMSNISGYFFLLLFWKLIDSLIDLIFYRHSKQIKHSPSTMSKTYTELGLEKHDQKCLSYHIGQELSENIFFIWSWDIAMDVLSMVKRYLHLYTVKDR